MNVVSLYKKFYKEALIADAAYESVDKKTDDNDITHLSIKKYPQFKVLAESTEWKISGMQAMLLQDKQGDIFLSIRETNLHRRAG